MALTRVSGVRVVGAGATTVYTGRGRLLGLLLSHDNAAVQKVDIHDNATLIATIQVNPANSPIYISFAQGAPGEATGGKQEGIPFATSLVVTRGVVEVNVWYLGY